MQGILVQDLRDYLRAAFALSGTICQPTIDKIIEQFFSGTKDGIARACALYEDTIFGKEEGDREDFEHCGTVIPNKHMEFDRDDVDRLEGQVTDERLEALREGAEPTEEERRAYRASVIAQVEDGSADADVIPGYWIDESDTATAEKSLPWRR